MHFQRNDSCERFIVATVYEGCRVLEVVAKDARECAKLVGVMLMHYGQLKAYGEGAQPVVIEVNKPGLFVHFNAWHLKVTVSGQSITRIVAEAVFVKRVGFFFHLSL